MGGLKTQRGALTALLEEKHELEIKACHKTI